tara:strand:- start:5882 stop:6220 length:339 start_codon:yes stop_codon:yes gene_type:complete
MVIKSLIAVVLGYFWYDKRKLDRELETYKNLNDQKHEVVLRDLTEVTRKQTEHDNKFVTDQRVRDIVKDEIKPLKEDVGGMKRDIGHILESLQKLTIELSVSNALREQDKNK